MKKRLLLVITLLAGQNLLPAQSPPGRREALKTSVKVNDYFMEKYADFTRPSYMGRFRPNNIWTRGVYCEGLMTLHTVYPHSDHYDYAYGWANFHKWGLRGGNITRNADDHCRGWTYVELYKISPDSAKVKNIKVSIDMLVNTPQVDDQTQIDAIQMGTPALAQLGGLTGKQKYYDKMW